MVVPLKLVVVHVPSRISKEAFDIADFLPATGSTYAGGLGWSSRYHYESYERCVAATMGGVHVSMVAANSMGNLT